MKKGNNVIAMIIVALLIACTQAPMPRQGTRSRLTSIQKKKIALYITGGKMITNPQDAHGAYVVAGRDISGDIVTYGTGIITSPNTIITSAHVIEPNKDVKSWHVYDVNGSEVTSFPASNKGTGNQFLNNISSTTNKDLGAIVLKNPIPDEKLTNGMAKIATDTSVQSDLTYVGAGPLQATRTQDPYPYSIVPGTKDIPGLSTGPVQNSDASLKPGDFSTQGKLSEGSTLSPEKGGDSVGVWPGDSGGPLFNNQGQVLGLVSRVYHEDPKGKSVSPDEIPKNDTKLQSYGTITEVTPLMGTKESQNFLDQVQKKGGDPNVQGPLGDYPSSCGGSILALADYCEIGTAAQTASSTSEGDGTGQDTASNEVGPSNQPSESSTNTTETESTPVGTETTQEESVSDETLALLLFNLL